LPGRQPFTVDRLMRAGEPEEVRCGDVRPRRDRCPTSPAAPRPRPLPLTERPTSTSTSARRTASALGSDPTQGANVRKRDLEQLFAGAAAGGVRDLEALEEELADQADALAAATSRHRDQRAKQA